MGEFKITEKQKKIADKLADRIIELISSELNLDTEYGRVTAFFLIKTMFESLQDELGIYDSEVSSNIVS